MAAVSKDGRKHRVARHRSRVYPRSALLSARVGYSRRALSFETRSLRIAPQQDSAGGTVTRVYDDLGRLTSETTPQGTVSYTYDAAGRRLTMQAASQAQVSYTYDNANRLTGITQGSTSLNFGYDAAGRRTSATLPGGITASYTWDAGSQLTGITYANGTTTVGT